MKISPTYLRVKQACEFLGISRTSFYNLVNEGLLPRGISYSSRMVVWRVTDLIDFAEGRAAK